MCIRDRVNYDPFVDPFVINAGGQLIYWQGITTGTVDIHSSQMTTVSGVSIFVLCDVASGGSVPSGCGPSVSVPNDNSAETNYLISTCTFPYQQLASCSLPAGVTNYDVVLAPSTWGSTGGPAYYYVVEETTTPSNPIV